MKKTTKYFDTSGNFKFMLFVSGMSPKSLRAIENISNIGETYFSENFDLQVIDITSQAEQARDYQIVAVPTLIKISPAPPRIIIGDLSDTNRILKILDIVND